MRTQLTEIEAAKCFILSRVHEIDQAILAFIYDTNSGRINEAIQAIEYAGKNVKEMYATAVRNKVKGEQEKEWQT